MDTLKSKKIFTIYEFVIAIFAKIIILTNIRLILHQVQNIDIALEVNNALRLHFLYLRNHECLHLYVN